MNAGSSYPLRKGIRPGFWDIAGLDVVIGRCDGTWRLYADEQASHAWLGRAGLDKAQFATRLAARDAALAHLAADPLPAASVQLTETLIRVGCGEHRTRDGWFTVTAAEYGRWEIRYASVLDDWSLEQVGFAHTLRRAAQLIGDARTGMLDGMRMILTDRVGPEFG